MRYPGDVCFLPPEARTGGDPKWRRHVVLTPSRRESETSVLAYATTSPVEVWRGAAAHLLDPVRGPDRYSGFVQPTYIAAYRLVPALGWQMREKVGTVVAAMPAVRKQLRRAIGLGTGNSWSGAVTGSLRGFIAELASDVAEECGARWAVIVTEPAYSRVRRYQLVLPLLNASEYEQEAADVRVAGKEWIRHLSGEWGVFLLSPKYIQTAFHERELDRVLPLVIDHDTIKEIEHALTRFFGL